MHTKKLVFGFLLALALGLLPIAMMLYEERVSAGYAVVKSRSRSEFDGKNQYIGLSDTFVPWVISDRGLLALDGLKWPHFPLTMNEAEKKLRMAPIKNRIREVIQENGSEFNFLWTEHGYAGPKQAGGIFLLSEGETVQEILLKEGLARFNRNWREGRVVDEQPGFRDLKSNRVQNRGLDEMKRREAEWLRLDQAARLQKAGYWSQEPKSMKYDWDDEEAELEKASK